MGDQTGISWTTATWNPWHGCRKISPGCKLCYMYREKARYKQDPRSVVRSKSTFRAPLAKHGRRRNPSPSDPRPGWWKWPSGSRVFACSWSDWFIQEADPWRAEAWEIIRQRPDLVFQILTKRPHRIYSCLPDDWGEHGYPNVWLGVSVEHQDQMWRLGPLLSIPAEVHFASAEPLLGPLDFREVPVSHYRTGRPLLRLDALTGGFYVSQAAMRVTARTPAGLYQGEYGPPTYKLDWIITGGESAAPHEWARPMHPQWARDIRDQCARAGTLHHHKQNGEWGLHSQKRAVVQHRRDYGVLSLDGTWSPGTTGWNGRDEDPDTGEAYMVRMGRQATGRLLDGKVHDDIPYMVRT